jgi:uncharacterized protein (TIGR02217 family)
MSITVFPDVTMPPLVIASGVRGRQIRRNDRTAVISGEQSINVVWTQTLREFEVGFVPMRREAWQAIETLHEITDGGAYGFLMLDPKDHVVTSETGVMASLGGGTYQLYKRYLHAASNRYKDRKITRPIAAGFQAFDALGNTLTATVDEETGIATISGTPASWASRFYVPVHFMDDSIDWSMVVPHQDPDSRFLSGPSCVLQEIRE